MESNIKGASPEKQRPGCVVVGVFEGRRLSASAQSLDGASRKYLSEVLRRGDHEGKPGTTLLLQKIPHVPAERVLLVGLGRERDFAEAAYRGAIAATARALKGTGAAEATVCLTELDVKRRGTAWKIEQAVILLSEGAYRFDQMKSKPAAASKALRKVTLAVARGDVAEAQRACERGEAIAAGMTLAKDLGNLPGNVCTPTYLAQQAVALGKSAGLKVQVLERKDIEKLGMGSFLAVAQGSVQPPKLIV